MKTHGPSSYWLPDGRIVFVFDTGTTYRPAWVIGVRKKRGEKTEISRYRGQDLGRYITEKQAREALRAYAAKRGLRPAY